MTEIYQVTAELIIAGIIIYGIKAILKQIFN